MPFISCIVTVFNDQETVRVSIESLLSQSYEDFEILIVDDGADEKTRGIVLSYNDPRIVYIRQSNDGLSSARNRALQHCRGEYVCFLDADDMRPSWAFESLAKVAKETNVDCIFSRGTLMELRGNALPFYDNKIFDKLIEINYKLNFDESLSLLMLLEPQSANKFIKRSFLDENSFTFPNGVFFEDILFHMGLVARMQSFEIVNNSCFTYFRRYGKMQITSSSSATRFDALSTGFMALEAFAISPRFQNMNIRTALLLSVSKLLKWCEETVSHQHKYNFRQILNKKMIKLDELYMHDLDIAVKSPLLNFIDYSDEIIHYIKLQNKRKSNGSK